MRIIGVRADGAQLVAVGAGISVILKGDQKSKPLDDRKAEKLGPWTPSSDNLADRRSVQKQLDRARMTFKLSEPMPRQTFNLVGPGKHSAKWHRCWEKVQADGHDESSAAAICTAQLGDESYDASIAEEVPDAMELGGAGSGNWGHAGRPGEIGGSGGGGGASYRQGDQVVVTDGGQKVQAHHSSPTRVTIPAGTQGRYIRSAGDDWHIVDTGHYESARVRGDQLRGKSIEGPGQHTFEQGGAHGPRDEFFERGGPAPSSPRAGGGETLEWKNEQPALPQYKPNPADERPALRYRRASEIQGRPAGVDNPAPKVTLDQVLAAHRAHAKAADRGYGTRDNSVEHMTKVDRNIARLKDRHETLAKAYKRATKLSVGEMVKIIGNVRGQGQTGRVLRIDAGTALVDGFGRFDLLDLAAVEKKQNEESQAQPQAQEVTSVSVVKPIKPSEPIGGDRIKKQKPVIAKPLYTVAAVRKPKIKIVKPIPVGA